MSKFEEGIRKALMAGIGIAAVTVEKSKDIIDEMVKKGEVTIEEGKKLKEEMKAKRAAEDAAAEEGAEEACTEEAACEEACAEEAVEEACAETPDEEASEECKAESEDQGYEIPIEEFESIGEEVTKKFEAKTAEMVEDLECAGRSLKEKFAEKNPEAAAKAAELRDAASQYAKEAGLRGHDFAKMLKDLTNEEIDQLKDALADFLKK